MKNRYDISKPSLSRPVYIMGCALALFACSQPETQTEPPKQPAPHVSEIGETSSQSTTESSAPKTSDGATNVRSAESHIHGGAMLSIVSEGNRIEIELETPLYNLLGFEYEPQTLAEKTLVSEVEVKLADPQQLISFNSDAKCAFIKSDQDIELFHHASESEDAHNEDDEHDEHHEDDEHHETHHDDHHENEESHSEDEHHDGDHDDESDSHKDIILNYALNCSNIDKLKTVKVEFFNLFPKFSDLELVYLGPSRQMSADLSPSRPSVDLTR